MRVLVAPDKFKGSLPATEVADNIAKELAPSGADAVTLPLADGGDGSVAAALAAGMRSVAGQLRRADAEPHYNALTRAILRLLTVKGVP